MPRRIWERITPELPRAPFSAPADRAAAVLTTSVDFASVLASASAERMVNSMFTPVSESATGNTLSRLISSMWVIRSPTEVCAQSRKANASSARHGSVSPDPTCPNPMLKAPPYAAIGGRQPIYTERQHWSHDTRRLLIVLAVPPDGSYSCQVVGPPVRSLAPESEEFHLWLPSAISAGRAPASVSRCHTPIAGPAVDGIPTSRACAFPTAPAATSTGSTSARPASRPARSYAAS